MPQNDLFSLAKLLGAKNISDSPFAKSPAGINYINQQSQYDNAEELLNSSRTPVGAIGAGINFYIQSKNKRKALEELGAELKADSAKKEQARSTLAGLFPENQRDVANTLDMDTLTSLAAKRLQQDPNAQADAELDRKYKMAQINKLNRESTVPVNPQTGQPAKPLPTQAIKLQNEELDTIGTLEGINADLGNIEKQIDTGKLPLGPVENIKSKVKNYVGMSDEGSRNFSSFKSTLEKQRNDSLRLNKGVQTEGDAVRAWNELFTNINDPNLVKQRLGEIKKINERGADLKKMNIDQIRANYGAPPLDYSGYENRPAAIGAGQNQGAPRRRVYDPSTGQFQ